VHRRPQRRNDLAPFKELHYFDQLSNVERASSPRCRDERDLRFLESIKSLSAKPYMDLEHYARLFEPKGSLLSGDISPNYSTLSNEVIRQVVGYFPTLKVIFLARDPVERVWFAEGLSCGRTRAPWWRDGNAMFIQTGFAFISLMICKEIPLNCGAPSCVFWMPIRISQAAERRTITTVGPGWKNFC